MMKVDWEHWDALFEEQDDCMNQTVALLMPVRMDIEFLGLQDPKDSKEACAAWNHPYYGYKVHLQSALDVKRQETIDYRTGVGVNPQVKAHNVWESLLMDLETIKTTGSAQVLAGDFGVELQAAKVLWSQLVKNKKKIQYVGTGKWGKILVDEDLDRGQMCQALCTACLELPINAKSVPALVERKWMVLSTMCDLDEQWDKEIKKIWEYVEKKTPGMSVPNALKSLIGEPQGFESWQQTCLGAQNAKEHQALVHARLECLQLGWQTKVVKKSRSKISHL